MSNTTAEYFTLTELCRSRTADAKGIVNTPPEEVETRLEQLIHYVLDPVRRLWGGPITVNSGYRCPELNRAVGGASGSQHLRGEAADITTGTREGNRRLFGLVSSSDIPFDQLIDESRYSWIHVSHSAAPRRQILHL
ncbi:MAG: D-Ala-D-Ala carboxypeptidase family metallohydrolase [Alistipes sp.]|nr:D-Ala-D-Ala carboxypeptidase family metallohydrolase [Alistipes sp.]